MRDARKQALRTVESIIAQLQARADVETEVEDLGDGWTPDTRAVCLTYFAEVRDRLLAGDACFQHPADHLLRELDRFGVIAGPIWQEAADLQQHLQTIRREAS